MNTPKTKSTIAAVPQDLASTLSGVLAQITTSALGPADRRKMEDRSARTPIPLIAMITHLAEQNGGTIAGVSFDTVAANAVLTSTAPTGIGICRQLLQRMEDDWIQQQVAVADPAFAIYRALGRLVNTPAGNALKPAYEQMQAIVKNRPPKTNRRRQPKAAATGASTTKPASPVTSNGVATTPAAATVAVAHALPTNGIATNSAS